MSRLLSPLVLLAPFLLTLFVFYSSDKRWRRSFLSASVVLGTLLTAITELLSRFHQLTFAGLLGAWILVSLAIAAVFSARRSHRLLGQAYRGNALINLSKANPFLCFVLLSLAIILAATGLLALAAPPNNWDSMVYHMSRVANWMANQSVDHYPAHTLRQLDSPPWSGFAILHLQVLSGGDRFANLVQWSSMVGCLIGVSLIAKQLGANPIGQMLSSIVCATIPMGVLQAATTQNDYVATFWVVCLAYNTLRICERPDLRTCLEFGASLGLALLTKATGYVYGFPLCVIWLVYVTRAARGRVWKWAIPSFLPILLINIGHWSRNFQIFQTPLGVSGNVTKNQLFTPAAIASNLIRNIGLHLPVAFQPVNERFEDIIVFIHTHLLKLDVNDPRTTFANTAFQLPVTSKDYPIFLYEDTSGNFLHLILVFAAVGLYVRYSKLRSPLQSLYLAALVGMVLLFNVLLAWQPWASRLHLTFFVLASAFVGSVLSTAIKRPLGYYFLVFTLTVASLPYVFFSGPRPLAQNPYLLTPVPSMLTLPRIEGYFVQSLGLEKIYIEAIDAAVSKNCYDIGLYPSPSAIWDYPFWSVARARWPDRPIQFRAVEVSNDSKAASSDAQPPPCAVFAVNRPDLRRRVKLENSKTGARTVYRQVVKSKPVRVYIRRRLLKRS